MFMPRYTTLDSPIFPLVKATYPSRELQPIGIQVVIRWESSYNAKLTALLNAVYTSCFKTSFSLDLDIIHQIFE